MMADIATTLVLVNLLTPPKALNCHSHNFLCPTGVGGNQDASPSDIGLDKAVIGGGPREGKDSSNKGAVELGAEEGDVCGKGTQEGKKGRESDAVGGIERLGEEVRDEIVVV
jgi:hypothetical protein